MNFNIGEMIATGKYTFVVLVLQSLFLITIIVLHYKGKNKLLLCSLSSFLLYSTCISMFFHHLNSIERFKMTALMAGTVSIEGVQQGMEWQQIFYNFELVIGALGLIFIFFLYFKYRTII